MTDITLELKISLQGKGRVCLKAQRPIRVELLPDSSLDGMLLHPELPPKLNSQVHFYTPSGERHYESKVS